jgi:hypothetical protein
MDRDGRPARLAPNPSALIAAELAFSRAAQEAGQWTAFRDSAGPGAVLFVPQATDAAMWLKGRADPPASVVWQPHKVWLSCDGSMGGTLGAWQRPDGSTGYFTTVWQRQPDGEYRWVMDQGDTLAAPMPAPDMIEGQVASCEPLPPQAAIEDRAGGLTSEGTSQDRTFRWSVRVDPRCGRIVTYWLWRGMAKGGETVVSRTVAPPPGVPTQACGAP